MIVKHQFLNEHFFIPESGIKYLFLGTFNHGFNWNTSDFFYGRGMYMWTIMSNLFIHNENNSINSRTINNNVPTLNQIFEICTKGKFVFADLIKGTKGNIDTVINQNQIYTSLIRLLN